MYRRGRTFGISNFDIVLLVKLLYTSKISTAFMAVSADFEASTESKKAE